MDPLDRILPLLDRVATQKILQTLSVPSTQVIRPPRSVEVCEPASPSKGFEFVSCVSISFSMQVQICLMSYEISHLFWSWRIISLAGMLYRLSLKLWFVSDLVKQAATFEEPWLSQALESTSMKLPAIVKPQIACGAADAHTMVSQHPSNDVS